MSVNTTTKDKHGEGDPFVNTLNAITEAANSPMEAGLFAIMAAVK